MGRPKKDITPEVPTKDTDLEKILEDLCNNELQAIELVKHLEGNSYKESEHTLDFCKSYAIAIIQTYSKDTTTLDVKMTGGGIAGKAKDKAELILATYGLMEGFNEINFLSPRVHTYYEYAHGYNTLIQHIWNGPSIDSMCRKIRHAIVWELTNTLYDLKIKNGGSLGFINQVPKELTLPKLRYDLSKEHEVLDQKNDDLTPEVKEKHQSKKSQDEYKTDLMSLRNILMLLVIEKIIVILAMITIIVCCIVVVCTRNAPASNEQQPIAAIDGTQGNNQDEINEHTVYDLLD